ncbi:MAG: tetraether lipid synthase Tes [Candidatus Asgardarchaeia archaeon]
MTMEKLEVKKDVIEKIRDERLKKVLSGEEEPPYSVLKRKLYTIQPSKLKKDLPRDTESLCPECGRVIKAHLFEKDGKVMIRKECPEHGVFEDVYFSDVELFLKFEMFAIDGVGIENPETKLRVGCPYDCGLCNLHFSHSSIVNIDLTNRCNMRCPICFANANAAGFVYEPSYDEVIGMLKLLKNMRPVEPPAIQFAGGEPTIYPCFFEVCKAAKEMGFPQVQVATNGLLMANDPTFAQRMRDSGVDTVYLQFDGFKEETYRIARGRPGFLKEKMKAIENARNVKPQPLAVVLVPVIVKGMNDDEVGKMVDFALENLDVIRGVNFQPVSFCGRINYEERIKGRYTIADLIHDLEEQTDYLTKDDFFPVPVAAALSELVSAFKKEPKVAFTPHPLCGAATYVLKGEDGKVTSITSFVDVWGLFKDALEIAQSVEGKFLQKFRAALKTLKLRRYIDQSKAPKGFNLKKLLMNVVFKGTKEVLGEFHWRVLFIGSMHFQDRYNYDIERVKRCVVHYATPDGRVIPFCAYNTGPTFRNEVESKFAMTFEEYRKRYNRDVNDFSYANP